MSWEEQGRSSAGTTLKGEMLDPFLVEVILCCKEPISVPSVD
jgi:hypothetical protein